MEKMNAGSAVFAKLKALGVDYVFVNSGTDYPPIIEGLAEAAAKDVDLPEAIVIPHEHAAVGMAHGYTLISGKCQAVMLHTNVGLSNGATGAINAACEHIPMLMMSGRTPVTEEGRFGSRTVPIGWGQEMRDQTALVREASKWDYELKFPEQIGGLMDRASAIANSTPKGPVYLSLPREILCEHIDTSALNEPTTISPTVGAPDPAAVQQAAALLANAKNPVIVAQRGSGDDQSFARFSKWVEDWGIAVSSYWATHLALPVEHPCHIGDDHDAALAEADVILVLDSLSPWWPDKVSLRGDVKVINMGPDAIFSRFPVRNFPSHVTINGENALTIPALADAMSQLPRDEASVSARRDTLKQKSQVRLAKREEQALAQSGRGLTKAHVAYVLGKMLEGKKYSVFSELGLPLNFLSNTDRNSWFQEPHSGGLGWGLPAALGGQLADPDRICVASMGDGSYMFANPTACHQIAEALGLPVLIVVLNNGEWGAVRHSVMGMYPDGYAANANQVPLTSLAPTPDFAKTAEASRAWARTVTKVEDLEDALLSALKVVQEDRRQALLDIRILQ